MEIKCQLDATDDIYCRFYCLLNMFRAPLCPSSGAREYYTYGRCLWYLVLWFSSCRYGVELRVMCPVCRLLQIPHVSGTIMPIIRRSRVLYRWLLPVAFGALVFRLSVWCGAEGCVSGLRAAAAACGQGVMLSICLHVPIGLRMIGSILFLPLPLPYTRMPF